MPTFFGMVAQQGVPNSRTINVRGFQDGPTLVFDYPYSISGVTRDFSGVPLAGVNVQLFRAADDSYVAETTSDANGAFSIPASNLFAHYLVAYKAGAPDVSGTTANTLLGA